MKKKIDGILASNPSLAKQVAMLLKEELENEVTDLTQVDAPAGTNDAELVPEAPGAETLDVTNADALARWSRSWSRNDSRRSSYSWTNRCNGRRTTSWRFRRRSWWSRRSGCWDEAKVEELEEVIEEATKLISELKKQNSIYRKCKKQS